MSNHTIHTEVKDGQLYILSIYNDGDIESKVFKIYESSSLQERKV